MEELPISAGLQIIDADLYAKNIPRLYRVDGAGAFDSLRIIEEAFSKITGS